MEKIESNCEPNLKLDALTLACGIMGCSSRTESASLCFTTLSEILTNPLVLVCADSKRTSPQEITIGHKFVKIVSTNHYKTHSSEIWHSPEANGSEDEVMCRLSISFTCLIALETLDVNGLITLRF